MSEWLVLFIGLCGGLATGAGYVAFITVLGVIPRLVSMTKSASRLPAYELALIAGVLVGTIFHISGFHIAVPVVLTAVVGLLSGLFIGMAAAALTEVLNVFPILARRAGLYSDTNALMLAVALGKTAGALVQWIWLS